MRLPCLLLTLAVAMPPAWAQDPGGVARDDASTRQVPDLIDLYNQTLRISPALTGAVALSTAAERARAAAKGQLLPQVGVFGEAAYIDERVQGDFFGIRDIDREDDFDRYAYGVGFEQAIVRPELWATLDQARLKQVQADLAEQRARSTLASELMAQYLRVLEAVEVKAAAEARVNAVSRQKTQVGSRLKAGLLTRADQSQAQSSASLAAVQESIAESELASAVARLRATSQWSARSLKGLSEDITFILPQPLDEAYWIERAGVNGYPVLQQELEVALARNELLRAQRSRWPTLDLFGAATELDASGGIEGAREQRDMRIGARAQIPIFAGGSVSAAISANEARVIQAEAELTRLRTEARLLAATRYRKVVVGRSQLLALQEAVDASRAAEAEFKIGFDAGTRTNADLLSATERRYFAEVELQRRRYGQVVDALELKELAGSVGPEDVKQLNRLLVRPVAIPF